MKLSKRGGYGIKALIELASDSAEPNIIQIREIAERENIPVKFLEQILLTLKNAGILHSRLGVSGGYYLARPADEITLGQIIRTLDGTLAPIRCVSKIAYERCVCPDEASCGLRQVMQEVRNAIADVLDNTTLADAARRSQMHRPRDSEPATRRRRSRRPRTRA